MCMYMYSWLAGCNMADLGIATQGGTVDPRCAVRRFVDSLSITSGVVCYNGTANGSRAVYICNNDTQVMRNCLRNGTWSGSIPVCTTANGIVDNSIHFRSSTNL